MPEAVAQRPLPLTVGVLLELDAGLEVRLELDPARGRRVRLTLEAGARRLEAAVEEGEEGRRRRRRGGNDRPVGRRLLRALPGPPPFLPEFYNTYSNP